MKPIMIVTLSLVMTFTSGASGFGQKKSKSEPQAEKNTEDKEKKSRVARPDKGDRALPGGPCCEITAIDADDGIVTARDTRTGKTFRFKVDSRSLLGSMRVGQKVYADMAAKKAGVKPGDPCCSIVGEMNSGEIDRSKPKRSRP